MLTGAEGPEIGFLCWKMPKISSNHSQNLGDLFGVSLR
jgi:hypothetical protein